VTVTASDTHGGSTPQDITVNVTNVGGVTINGKGTADLIDETHTVAGQPLPTGEEDTINGGGGIDTNHGLGGNDIINGGAGADIMYGGAGNDTFIVDNAHDQAIENPGEGSNDTVQSSVNFTLGDNIEQLYLTGTGNTHGTGNAGDNFISGNSGN